MRVEVFNLAWWIILAVQVALIVFLSLLVKKRVLRKNLRYISSFIYSLSSSSLPIRFI